MESLPNSQNKELVIYAAFFKDLLQLDGSFLKNEAIGHFRISLAVQLTIIQLHTYKTHPQG